jgi:hypothetical protein
MLASLDGATGSIYDAWMTNRFPGRACVLCPQPPRLSEGVGEHIIPKWYIEEFHSEAPFFSELAGSAYRNRKGDVAVQSALPVPHVPMCGACNGLLNTYFEEPAKSVIRKLVPRSAGHAWADYFRS